MITEDDNNDEGEEEDLHMKSIKASLSFWVEFGRRERERESAFLFTRIEEKEMERSG